MNWAARHPRDAVAAAVFVGALIAWWFAGYTGHDMLSEIAVWAIFAMSLDFIVGYAGMVSLGHALYFGLAAYGMASLTVFLHWPPSLAAAAAIASAAAAAALTGLIVIRVAGIFMIMITLALGQMGWAYLLRTPTFGGYSGMSGIPLLDLGSIGLTLLNPAHFSLFAIAVAALVYLGLARLVDSPFGHMLVAVHQNEVRARALGLPVARYKFAAFVVAGAVGGLGGILAVQRTQFVSPDLMVWMTSGDALIIVILGGLGSLIGPVFGAVVWVVLRHVLSGITSYWMMVVGIIFICVMLFAHNGVYGLLMRMLRGRRNA